MRLFGGLLAGLFLSIAGLAPVAAAPSRDWSAVTARTPGGAFIQGNPQARVKLVEYFSYTCPHCGKLEAEAIPPLTAKYIRAGLVSYEVRHALRDGFDFSAALVARCGGPTAFFSRTTVIFAQQDAWMKRASEWVDRSPPKEGLPPEQLLPLLASGAGLDTMFAAHGLTADKAKACVANTAERDVLSAQAEEAWKTRNIPGTPAFLINGTLTPQIGSWAELDAALTAALKK